MRRFVTIQLAAWFFCSLLTAQPAATASRELTIDQIMEGQDFIGVWPSQVRWSGDSQKLYFRWRRPDSDEKEESTFVINQDGSGLRHLSEDEAEAEAWPANGVWNDDRTQFLFSQNGDIFLLDRQGNRRQLTQTRESEQSPRFGHDADSYIFQQGENLFRLDSGGIEQLTDFRSGDAPSEKKLTDSQKFLEEQQEKLFDQFSGEMKERTDRREERRKRRDRRAFYYGHDRITSLTLSPDEKFVCFVREKPSSKARTTIVPAFVTEDGFTEDRRSRTKVGDDRDISTLGIYDVDSGEVTWVEETEGAAEIGDPVFSPDGSRAALLVISGDYKERTISSLDLKTGELTQIDHLRDEAWVGGPGLFTLGWLGDNQTVYFVSEADGFAHLYSARYDGSQRRQLTHGEWEVTSVELSADKSHWYLTTSQVHPGERHFYSLPVSGGEMVQLTSMEGSNEAILSPDETRLAILYSYSNQPPEIYIQPNRAGAEARRLTHSTSKAFKQRQWADPELVRIPARDGQRPWARFYKPSHPAPGNPAIIFVHGAGYLQNVHKWWSSYYREYLFHNLLLDAGYQVLDIDYRGSSGYGRNWRTAIYRHMGGKDLTDQIDGAHWLIENQGVNPRRIGIYGGSYGGFITLMAMFNEPDVFAAGAALRPVTDWAHYNHWYTSRILNQPQDDLEAYQESSPIYFAEGLKGALLICHGMVDTNVHFQDTVRLVQRLIELHKENWQLAVYPVESHGFLNASSWADEYKRIFKLFEENLKK